MKRSSLLQGIAIGLAVLLLSAAHGAALPVSAQSNYYDIYVDVANPHCSDQNPGTERLPLCTIQAAADRATPGATIHVRKGVYRERVAVRASGTADALIKFVTDNAERVVIQSPGEAGFDLLDVEYIKIHGFEITGGLMTESDTAESEQQRRIAHGGGIRGVNVTNSIFTHNVVHGNDAGIWLALSHHNMISNNIIYHNEEASVRIKHGNHNHIANNLIFNNGTRKRWGITFYCAIGTRVYHNTVVEPSGGAVYIYEGSANLSGTPPGAEGFCVPSNDSQVYDNIGVVVGIAPESAPLVIGSSTTTDRPRILNQLYGPLTNQYHHNLWFNARSKDNIVSWGDFGERNTFPSYGLLSLTEFQHKQPGYGAHSMAVNPMFVNPARNNFQLLAHSPAKRAASDGTDLGVNFQLLPTVNLETLPRFWK